MSEDALLKEYYEIIQIVNKFDERLLTVKNHIRRRPQANTFAILSLRLFRQTPLTGRDTGPPGLPHNHNV